MENTSFGIKFILSLFQDGVYTFFQDKVYIFSL